MILAGLWFGTKKPPMHMFLRPIFDMLSDLESKGVKAMLFRFSGKPVNEAELRD